MTGSIILGVTFGMNIQPDNDPHIALAEKALHSMAMVGNVGSYMGSYLVSTALGFRSLLGVVDYLPISKIIVSAPLNLNFISHPRSAVPTGLDPRRKI